ncbi:hypothetical protein CcaCcLH18_02952 [Colletotrichum camelliae]|nr:hypothetical protein CcaCcLH18_02952 [Colletotrichum camelliae]
MERFENMSKQYGGSRPHLSYAQAARAGHRSEQAKINDVAKWVAAVRRVIANIPANPSSPSTPDTPTASGEYSRKSSPSLAYDHSTTAIAPFSNLVPAPNKVSVALGSKSPLLPIPDDNVSEPHTKMIRISELPFEIQDDIFELGTSMLIYAVNMLVDSLLPVSHDDLTQYGEASDVVKWMAAMRSLTTSIPTIPSAPESPVASTDENSLPQTFPNLFEHVSDAVSIAPFANMVPTLWGHPDDTRKTGLPRPASSSRDYDPPFIPMPEGLDVANKQCLPKANMRMIQISKLPLEMQDAIFEVGTSMLIYAINVGIRDAKNCDYEARRSFGPRREVFSSSGEVVREQRPPQGK